MQDKGPSGERETDFILVHDDVTNIGSQNAHLREIIQEQQIDITSLPLDLERAKWTMKYLEQRKKQLEGQQAIMELQNIHENCQAAQRRRIELTSLEKDINDDRDSWLKRIKIHLEKLLEKADRDKALLRHMVFHYKACTMSSKARIRNLKAKLKKAIKKKKRKKEHDHLRILVEASLAQHDS